MFSCKMNYDAIKINQILTINKQIKISTKLAEIYHARILVLGKPISKLPLSYHRKKTPAHSYLSSVKNFINTNPINNTRHLEALKPSIYIKVWVSVLNTLKDSNAAFIPGLIKEIQKSSKTKIIGVIR